MASKKLKKFISKISPLLNTILPVGLISKYYSGQGQILMFHRIVPRTNEQRIHNHLSLEITPEHLEMVIQYFRNRNYEFLSLDELYAKIINNNLNKKFVVFTFDDGYVDNYTTAYPILKKHNIPFTVYITTDMPDNNMIIWWYLLEELIRKREQISFDMESRKLDYDISNIQRKEIVFNKIRNIFNNNSEYITPFFEKYNIDPYKKSERLALTWDQIRNLSNDPLVTIGAHTITHCPLSNVQYSKAKFEILESRSIIESNTGNKIDHFSYPFGSKEEVRSDVFDIVNNNRFKTAVTTRIGNIFKEHKNYLNCLPRININSTVNKDILDLLCSGFYPAIINKFKRIVTH